jgi:hypothetical protein
VLYALYAHPVHMKRMTITITDEDFEWVKENHVHLSGLVQDFLAVKRMEDEVMKGKKT